MYCRCVTSNTFTVIMTSWGGSEQTNGVEGKPSADSEELSFPSICEDLYCILNTHRTKPERRKMAINFLWQTREDHYSCTIITIASNVLTVTVWPKMCVSMLIVVGKCKCTIMQASWLSSGWSNNIENLTRNHDKYDERSESTMFIAFTFAVFTISCPISSMWINKMSVAAHPIKGNAVFLQDGWRYQRHLVAKEGITALGTAREEACRGWH